MENYNELILWKNKCKALEEHNKELGEILKTNIPDTLKLCEIINVVRLKDFSDTMKIELISRILKEEVNNS